MKALMIDTYENDCVGVAKDYEKAIQYLIDNNYINKKTRFFNDDDEDIFNYSLEESGITFDEIKKWGIKKFNQFSSDTFYLYEIDDIPEETKEKAIIIIIDYLFGSRCKIESSYKKAICYLINSKIITEDYPLWIEDSYHTLKDTGFAIDDIKNWNVDKFNKCFNAITLKEVPFIK